jgi:hypothetical protein
MSACTTSATPVTTSGFLRGKNNMIQKLGISKIVKFEEVEPAIFEMTVTLIDDSIVVLRMNVFLAKQIGATLSSLPM